MSWEVDERVEADGSITVDLTGCARCHSDGHTALRFEALEHPVEMEDGEPNMTHWAPCPTNGQPILLTTLSARADDIVTIPRVAEAPARSES